MKQTLYELESSKNISYEIWRAGHLKGEGGFPGGPTCVSVDHGVSNDVKQQRPHN